MIPLLCDRIEAAPQGGGTPLRGLTHSSGTSREGLAMKATRTRRASAEDRFFAKVVEDTSGCWLWTGATSHGGYGQFHAHYRAGEKKMTPAHRWSYEFLIGGIPEGLQLDHLCRVRRCVNPWHLEPVTPQVNTLRGTSMVVDQAAATHCVNGHPFDEKNTYIRPGGLGRACLACRRATFKRSQARRATCSACGKEMTRGALSNHRRLFCPLRRQERP